MGPHATHDELGPGLHVLSDDEPLALASTLAVELKAELCVTIEQADAVVETRASLPRIEPAALAEVGALARRLARAERIAARTRERAVLEVGERLAVSSGGLAVHPTTIRDRAAAVERAREAVQQAEQAISEHEADMVAFDARAAAQASVAAADEAEEAEHRHRAEHLRRIGSATRSRRARALVVLAVTAAVGAALVAAGVPWWLAIVPAVLALGWAVRSMTSRDAESDDDLEGRLEVSSLLSQVGATADELFNSRRAESELGEQTTLMHARRDRSLEELRVAERSWRELAGEDVGIDQLDDVIRRFDPQHEDARTIAGETVGVRTTETVVRQLMQRWEAFWKEHGLDVPAAEDAERAAERLARQVAQAVVLVGDATARGDALAEVAPAATVVVLNAAVGASGVAG